MPTPWISSLRVNRPCFWCSPREGHTGSVGLVAFSPDGTRLLSGGGTLNMWEDRPTRELWWLPGSYHSPAR